MVLLVRWWFCGVTMERAMANSPIVFLSPVVGGTSTCWWYWWVVLILVFFSLVLLWHKTCVILVWRREDKRLSRVLHRIAVVSNVLGIYIWCMSIYNTYIYIYLIYIPSSVVNLNIVVHECTSFNIEIYSVKSTIWAPICLSWDI